MFVHVCVWGVGDGSVAQSCPTLWDSMDCSPPGYWSGLPFPTPGDFPDPGIQPATPVSPALGGGFFALSHLGSPVNLLLYLIYQLNHIGMYVRKKNTVYIGLSTIHIFGIHWGVSECMPHR